MGSFVHSRSPLGRRQRTAAPLSLLTIAIGLLVIAAFALLAEGARDFYKVRAHCRVPAPVLCHTAPVLMVPSRSRCVQILGVPKDASDAVIKRAFHKLSLKYHPDKNKGDAEAHKRFVEVNEANDVLSNPDKRQIYDVNGEEGLKEHEKRAAAGQQGGGMFPFGDLFGQNKGGKRGPDVKMELAVTLEELYSGTTKSLKISRKVVCRSCKGTGAKGGDVKKCSKCNGQGVTMQLQQIAPGFNIQMQTPCPHCGGTGKIAKATCDKCRGERTVMEEKSLDAVIEKGMPDGEELVFERASEQLAAVLSAHRLVQCSPQSRARPQALTFLSLCCWVSIVSLLV
jgi:hypothetical protein